MDEKQQVVFAALIHHVGIFFTLANNKAIAENTKTFCDKLCDHNPALKNVTLWRELAVVDKNIENRTTLQKLILAAHKFSISEQIGKNDTTSHYLQPILEKVTLSNSEKTFTHHLPLHALSLEQNSIYPTKSPENQTSTQDYKKLEAAFWDVFNKMPHFEQLTENTLSHLTYNLLSLFERFFSQVPALENTKKDTTSDISLFDHLRIKATIAEGLYEFHQQNLESADFEDEQTEKWALICGDFSGIQKFIYNIVQKNAAKALRGRSLYIQLLCDSIAQHLTQKLNLFYTCQIYSSGGKFYLLIPINKIQNLKEEVANINRWLLTEFRGLIFLGIGHASVEANDFRGGNMGEKWKKVNDNLMKDRSQRFRAVMHDKFFEPMELYVTQNKEEKPYCEVCGRDDKEMQLADDDERHICEQCKQLEELGAKLSRVGKANPKSYTPDYFLWVWGEKQPFIDLPDNNPKYGKRFTLIDSKENSHLALTLYLFSDEELQRTLRKLDENITANSTCFLQKINHTYFDAHAHPHPFNSGFRLIGLWSGEKELGFEPRIDEDTKEPLSFDFQDFAERSNGIKRLGILRMDVDNLGQVFVNGLKFETQQMGSLSRVATLSRQLNLFFSGYLNKLLENNHRTQIIYAGGDDLFLIGSWDELPDVANKIRQEFTKYCAGNPNFTLSGGMTMVRGKYPISRAADLAGREEEKAKKLKYTCANSPCQKNAFCFLETPIAWDMYEEIENFKNLLIEIIEDSDGSHAIINRLRDVVIAMQEFERLSKKENKEIEEIQQLVMYQKWRWRLVYNLARMESRYPKLTKEKLAKLIDSIINNRIDGKILSLPPSHWLPLPVRWAEFLTRKGRA
jgi:CRISPR-associated protein Csm1